MNIFFSQNIPEYGTNYNGMWRSCILRSLKYSSTRAKAKPYGNISMRSIVSNMLPSECKTMSKRERDQQ